MSGTRFSIILGAVPVIAGLGYWILNAYFGDGKSQDAAGAAMLVALGLAMGFGSFVLLRGATDL